MFHQTTALALRLRNTTRAHLTTSKPCNFETVKARTPHWEPDLKFEDLTPNPRQKNEEEERGEEIMDNNILCFRPQISTPGAAYESSSHCASFVPFIH
jgi:hypothetical protein